MREAFFQRRELHVVAVKVGEVFVVADGGGVGALLKGEVNKGGDCAFGNALTFAVIHAGACSDEDGRFKGVASNGLIEPEKEAASANEEAKGSDEFPYKCLFLAGGGTPEG